jgi:Flp pilus assembly pilin Flp
MVYQFEEWGQGLVEYALTLVLVAVVAVGILTVLGPQVGDVFSRVDSALMGGVITGVSAVRTGSMGNDLLVTVAVAQNVTVTVVDSQSGQTQTVTCNGSCTVTFTAVGFAAGTVTASANGQSRSVAYPAK